MIWKNILASQPTLKEGLRWRVGNDKNIKIWDDKWLLTPSSFAVQSPPKILNAATMVNELMDADGKGWNYKLISEIFWEEECVVISNIPLGKLIQEDKLIWNLTKNGIFFVKSAYFASLKLKRGAEGLSTFTGWGNK